MYIFLTSSHDIIHVHDTLLLIGQACTCPKDLRIFISAFSACSFCKIMEIHHWPGRVSVSENFLPGSSCMLSNTYREMIFLSFLYICRANAHIKHHEGFSPYMIFKSKKSYNCPPNRFLVVGGNRAPVFPWARPRWIVIRELLSSYNQTRFRK